MEETAVDWLFEELFNSFEKFNNGEVSFGEYLKHNLKLREQAKAMEKEQNIAFGKRCFYKGFEKAENDDANCFTAWREEANELLTFKSE